ncbi:two-partner secretion domain-containing protein [Megasphaera elsdenii]|uniref:two-partner secretion domain-containing protein n=1 Tax=Megasphaera elsdenii TaxID=907 RepID=UPI00242F9F94|nr:filamentous hemagglutinin N-terminal domain-containing protein [Megasphaera elsdenii]
MKYYSKKQWTQKLTIMVFLAMALGGTAVQAMPSGADIRSGQGSISQDGKNMTVQQNSQRMAIDWTKFDIAKDETVRYAQPDRNAISLNRVTGGQQSVIAGNLNANGNVVLVNPNGVVFTKNSSVDVGGLVASTARLNDEAMKNFSNGKDSLGLSLDKDSTASVINEGQIKAQGGLVALHAANVENKGTITNEGGTLAMAAAKNLTLSAADDDKLNFTVDGELAKSQALNSGSLKADGGYVVMTAKSAGDVLSTVVNNTGTIEAKTLRKNEKGQILLDGGDKGQVEVSGTLDASGTEDGQSAGSIKVIGEKTIVHDGTNLLARGAIDGGKIETSGDVLNLGDTLNIDAKGGSGKHGEWLLDPLEVLIQDDKPTLSNKDQTHGTVNEGSETQINYNDPPSETPNADATYSSTSWIQTKLITDILNKGTDVTIQAASTSQAASITVNSAINPNVGGDGEATLELDAQRNITINKEIKASGGKLNVKLNSDTDGDGVGAVIINADISTNGGTFTSGSGGNVKFTAPSGTKAGAYAATGIEKDTKPNIAGHTVGTYFGYVVPEGQSAIELSGEKNNRNITTNGGAITLDGEVAIGLNGGVLTLDTSKKDGTAGGNVNITGIVNSGNSYDTYIFGTEKWNQLVKNLVKEYLDHKTVPSYRFVGINYTKNTDGTYSYTTQAKHFDKGESHYAFRELNPKDVNGANWTYTNSDATLDTQHTRWYATTVAGDGYNSFIMKGTTPTTSQMSIDEWLIYYRRTEPDNYATKYANGNKDTNSNLVTYEKIQNDPNKMAMLKSDISALIAHNWFASATLAKSGNGADPGDSYLATITTALENSLSTPNSQKTLWVGGMGSGVRNKTNDKNTNPYSQYPADPSHKDGFYWVTGPEGLVTNEDGTTGTKFWDTSKSSWNKDLKKSNYGEQVYGYTKWSSWSGGGQPDNSSPFLTVGYGNNNAWDDAAIDGGTTVGFVQETNLYNSSLNIKTDGGKVTLQGDLGKSVGLDTVKIDAGSGSVTTGNTTNAATEYNHGTIYADHGVYINGGEVTVGGEIHIGGTDVEATRNTDSSFSDYLDNVTINSAGDIEVHGITSNTYDVSNEDGTKKTPRGGKISLTSTGDTGKITLGAGVDYNGNATDGTLAAASTAAGAVVVDAQGSQGSLVNSTKGTAAITTGTDGTWQVYVNSPSDYDTSLGNNLNSNTNAQWTAKSGSNTTVKTNSSNNTLSDYTVTSSNKFIFQVTPVITISGGNQKKTYGDTLTDDQLRKLLSTSATYTDSTGKDVDVTQFGNFKEANYLTYVTSSDGTKTGTDAVAVSSGGAFATATRTDGNEKNLGTDDYKTASDGNRAFYVFNVEEDGAKALNGYDLKTVNGDIEILRKTLTINTDATQTYGNDAVTSGTPEADSTQLVNGDTLDTGSISYKIATDGKYADSKGRNDTAHVGSYENQYLTTGATVKASDGSDASANYAVTGSGTITVNPADLYLKVRDVSTTYGTAFDDTKYGYTVDSDKRGLVNGDTQDAVLGDQFLSYTNNGNATDPDKIAKGAVTQNVGNYELLGTANRTLADYNVHITSGTATVNKAKLALTVGDTSTTYGSGDWTPYTYTLTGNANGDTVDSVKENGITAVYTNTGAVTDAASNEKKIYTKDADGKYQLLGDFTLTGQTAKNYEIETNTPGKATVNKATVKVKLNDVSTTYGTAFDTDKYGYDPSKIEGLTNGDKTDVVTQVLNGDYKTGNIQYTNTGDASAEEKLDGKVTKTVNGGPYYLQGTTSQTLGNYNIEIENGNATINKATLHLSTGNYTETYGDAETVQKDLDRATTVTGEKNGDSLADLVPEIDIHNTSKALLSDTRTNDVKYKADGSLDSYSIITDFNKSLDNYNVEQDKTGSVTLKPKEITIKNTMTQQYGSSDRTYKEATVPEGQLANGDKISTKDLKFDIKADGEYAKSLAENKKNNSEAVTADVGTYTGELIHIGGGITHADGSDAYKNYKVTVEGDIVVTRAPLTITTEDVTTEYGTVKNTTSKVTGLVNGDQNYALDISYDYGDYGHGYLDDNTRTNNVGSYDITTNTTNTTSDFLKNYTISGGNAKLTITPKDVYFHVDGKGSTFDDIVYTVTDPNHPGNRDAINSQLLYGETVTGGYGIGQALPDTPGSKEHYYTVDSTINGTPVYDNNGQGTQVGNYVYHPTGQAVIHFDQPQKPDQTTHYVEGAHRPQDKLESALPVFRVDVSGVVKQYGTYGIESQSQAVTLSPTGMRMPEPNQTSTQDRKYLTTLKTAHGHGTFRLEYNGVVLRVIPVDPAAEQIVTDGDKMKNVALSEQALHVAYTQMGLDLVNLKGVYIYMAPM